MVGMRSQSDGEGESENRRADEERKFHVKILRGGGTLARIQRVTQRPAESFQARKAASRFWESSRSCCWARRKRFEYSSSVKPYWPVSGWKFHLPNCSPAIFKK